MNITNLHLIGCGGVGSYLLAPLLKTARAKWPKCKVVLHDADTIEEKNIDRQLFSTADIGGNKAEVLAARFTNVTADPSWFHEGTDIPERAVLMVCVDNHRARAAALDMADRRDCAVFIGGNEEMEADAYAYFPLWKDTPLDPRVRFPEILTDQSGDPMAASAGCTGEEVIRATGGQTAVANFLAAGYMLHLFSSHFFHGPKLTPDNRAFLPAQHKSTPTLIRTLTANQLAPAS